MLGWLSVLHSSEWIALAGLREPSPLPLDAAKAVHACVCKPCPFDVELKPNGLTAIRADGKRASLPFFTRVQNGD
jgi:hypothetical protein